MKQRLMAGILVVLMLLIVSCGKTEEVSTSSEATKGTTENQGEPAKEDDKAQNQLPKHDSLVLEVGDRSVSKEVFEKNFLFKKLSVLNSYGKEAFDGEQGKVLADNIRNQLQQELAKEQVFSMIAQQAGIEQDMQKAEKIYTEEFLTKNTEETLKYFEENKLDKEFVVARIALENQIGAFVEALHNQVKESDAYKEMLQAEHLVRASHILVPEADEAKAKEIKEELDKDPSRFAEFAKEHSKDGSAQNGGDLGYFSKTDMIAEFSDAAFGMEVNEISEPVKSKHGWHIIQVTDKGTIGEISEKSPEDESLKRQLLKHSQAEIIKLIDEKSAAQEEKTPIKYYSLEN